MIDSQKSNAEALAGDLDRLGWVALGTEDGQTRGGVVWKASRAPVMLCLLGLEQPITWRSRGGGGVLPEGQMLMQRAQRLEIAWDPVSQPRCFIWGIAWTLAYLQRAMGVADQGRDSKRSRGLTYSIFRRALHHQPIQIPWGLRMAFRETARRGLPEPIQTLKLQAHTMQLISELMSMQQNNQANSVVTQRRFHLEKRLERAKEILRQNIESPPDLPTLARQVGCSPHHLSRKFSEATGQTLSQYLRSLRLQRAADLLRAGTHNVTEAAFAVGYSSLGHFSSAFAQEFGRTPRDFLRGESRQRSL